MSLAAVLTALVLLLAPGLAPAQPLFSSTQNPLAGERVFDAKGCVKCHAVNGVGGRIGPDLARTTRPRTFYDLAAALWNHAPRMATRMQQLGIARPQLDAREAGDVAAYLFTLSYFDARGNAKKGRALFVEKKCGVCHEIGGTGGRVGPRLDELKPFASPMYLATAMWNHGPQMAETMRKEGVTRPTFRGSELIDLVAYLNTAVKGGQGELYVLPGRAGEGRRLFIEKRCAVCHTFGEKEDAGAPDLAGRGALRTLPDFVAAMWNKAPAMTAAMEAGKIPVPQLRPEDMADIVAFIYSARYFRQAGDPRNGVLVATNKGCFNCHGLYGERGKTAGDLTTARGIDTAAGVLSALWNHAYIAEPKPARDRGPWPTFRGEEMADLVAYLRMLKPAK